MGAGAGGGDGDEGEGAGEAERVRGGRNRPYQAARGGKRRLFNTARRQVFLEWFAATANVVLSAGQAGINYKTAFKHRMNDEAFRDAWDRALEQGLARQKAKLLETRSRAVKIGVEGDLDAPETEPMDPQLLMALLREGERRLAGYPKTGARPHVATNAEVRAALIKALGTYGVRVEEAKKGGRKGPLYERPGGEAAAVGKRARKGSGKASKADKAGRDRGGGAASAGPLRHASNGPPHRSGEDSK